MFLNDDPLVAVLAVGHQKSIGPRTNDWRAGLACNGTLPKRTLIVRKVQVTSANGADLVDFVPVQILEDPERWKIRGAKVLFGRVHGPSSYSRDSIESL